MTNDQKLIAFLNNFNTHLKKNKKDDAVSIINLVEDFKPFVARIKENNKRSTPDYNIFNILRIQFLEAKVHTPFLTNLLDPEGSHAQESLFLRAFVQNILQLNFDALFKDNLNRIKVSSELRTSYGILDILIYNNAPSPLNKFAIIIENKIQAPDQKEQISRYYNYAKNHLKLKDDQIIIAYLTLNRKGPSEKSLTNDLNTDFLNKGILRLICYNPDIVNWLSELMNSIDSQQLKQILVQYINMLKEFTYAEN